MLKSLTSFDELRAREFARLGEHAYLDYTGSALYADSQLRAHHALLEAGLFGNPHSDSQASRASSEIIDAARRRALAFFDVDESTHDLVFTANATAAIKLVAEGYPFGPETSCVLSVDNHNSVNGLREYARRAGSRLRTLPLDGELRLLDPAEHLGAGPGLLAFPAQSNFSGVLHPLALVGAAHERGFDVLLDAAAYVASHALSLRDCPADYVALSFYKLFGYPTGLGALIARRGALARLRRPWFAGGTVLYASMAADRHRLRARHEGFEDGTPGFLEIAALEAGFVLLEELQMPRVTAHVDELTRLLLERLRGMPHVTLHGPATMEARGGTIAFNVRGVPYGEVEAAAREAGVSLRGGCFCNPGASECAFGLDAASIASCLDTLGDGFTHEAYAACSGRPVGAVRASLGLANNRQDVERAAAVIESMAEMPGRCT